MIVGTSAFTSQGPNRVSEARSAMPCGSERLLALDSKDGRIVVKGWQEALRSSRRVGDPDSSSRTAAAFCALMSIKKA